VSALDRKLRRDLFVAKGRLLAITSILTLGVMCFVYMKSAYFNLQIAQSQYYARGRMADFWIDVKKVPVGELDRLADLPGITEIRARIGKFATVDLPEVVEPLNGLVLSLPERHEPVINDVFLKRGSYFTDRRDNEVIVNDAFATAHKIRVGDRIHLLLNNRRQELHVVGTAISCEFVYLLSPGAIIPDPKRFGVFYVKHRFAEDVFDMQGASNQIVGRLAPQFRDNPEPILRQAERLLDDYGVFAVTPRKHQVSHRLLSDEIAGLGTFSTVMPAIFLTVAALVLNVLMTRWIQQQRTLVGMLKAMGYSNLQVAVHFLKFGAAIGLVGGVLGCVAGYFMAGFVTSIYRRFYEFPELVNLLHPTNYLIGLGISLLCALIGSIQGARAALRLDPAEAMRPAPPIHGRRIWLENFPRLWGRLGFGWRMVLRGLVRHWVRTGVGVLSAAVGVALLTGGFMMAEAMDYLVEFQYDRIVLSDMDLGFASEKSEDALREARHLPGVDRAEPVLEVGCTFISGPHEYKGGIQGLSRGATLTVPRDSLGQPIAIPESGLAMSRKLAEILDLKLGEHVTIRPIKGLRYEQQVPVTAITDSYLGVSVYADIEYLSGLVDEELALTGVQMRVDPRRKVRKALYRELKRLPALQSINERANTVRNLRETLIATQNIFIGLLTLFAGVICFGSILNASLVNLTERTREVATLQVLGYTPWQIGGLFLRENLLVNLVGALLGLPLGYWLIRFMALFYDTEMFRFPIVDPPSVYLRAVVFAIGFGLAAHAIVQWSIYRLNYLEALNVME